MNGSCILDSYEIKVVVVYDFVVCSSSMVQPQITTIVNGHIPNVCENTTNNDLNAMNLCVRSETKEATKVDLSTKGKIDLWPLQVHNLLISDVYHAAPVTDHIFKEHGNIS